MKKIILIPLFWLIAITCFAQSKVTIANGAITINGTTYGIGDVAYIANYSNNTIQLKARFGPTYYLLPESPTGIKNGTTNAFFTSMDDIVSYLGALYPQSSGSGGGVASSVSVNNTSPIPVAEKNAKTYTDITVALTGSSQIIQTAVASGVGIVIQNLASTPLYINFGASATAGPGSIYLPQYGSYEAYVTQSVSVLGTAGSGYTAKKY